MICIDDARTMAQEHAENGDSAHSILSHLYAAFDGFRFYEAKGKIWMEGDTTYIPPHSLCTLPQKRRGTK